MVSRGPLPHHGPVTGLRDYLEWHRHYDDPGSELSWRLGRVQDYLGATLDTTPGPVRILSACSGDGRDVIGVLARRDDADRVQATLVELHPQIARQATEAAASASLGQVEVQVADAGNTDAYVGAAPAHVVVLVGILGNISDGDIQRTIRAAPQLCQPGATLLWSRARDPEEVNDAVRAWFAEAGFTELDYAAHPNPGGAAVGAFRYDGDPQPLVPGQPLFTFLR